MKKSLNHPILILFSSQTLSCGITLCLPIPEMDQCWAFLTSSCSPSKSNLSKKKSLIASSSQTLVISTLDTFSKMERTYIMVLFF